MKGVGEGLSEGRFSEVLAGKEGGGGNRLSKDKHEDGPRS